eukprot:PLAT177.8.p2 GENE.PLAT177.8~~PLAT177.8.p2  ORF type:complete len:156 (+),score=30.25 PLAT177.8:31-498(+)
MLRSVSSAPLRAFVFMDASWVFYSVYRRLAPERFGARWAEERTVQWKQLAPMLEMELEQQMGGTRPVEVARVLAFGARSNEPLRQQFFSQMEELNFELHAFPSISDSPRRHEKCVDIALAVEMLHYATEPGAFDVGACSGGVVVVVVLALALPLY